MLSEQRVLQSVRHNVTANAFDVKWINEVIQDGVVVSSIPHRCSYGEDRKAQFEFDLGVDAARYVAMAGW